MITRKVVQHGASTLTVSLPYKWISKVGLEKGDTLFMNEQGSNLLLSTKSSNANNAITLKFGPKKKFFKRHLLNVYREGYTDIVLEFSDAAPLSEIIIQLEQLLGFEIVEQDKHKVVIKDVASVREAEFLAMVKRLFIICREFLASVGDKNLHADSLEKEINKITNYCLRAAVLLEPKQIAHYTTVINLLEQVGDAIHDLAALGKKPILDIDDYFEKLIVEFHKQNPDIGLLKNERLKLTAKLQKQKPSWEVVHIWQIVDNLHHIEVSLQ